MVEIIEKLGELGPLTVIIIIALVIALVPLAISGWKEFIDSLGYTTKKGLKEKKHDKDMETLKQNFVKYQQDIYDKQQEYHQQSIDIRNGLIENQKKLESNQDSLSNDVKNLTNMMQMYINKEKRRTIATLRTTLWQLHAEFTTQGYMTPDGLKTFQELGAVYEEAGGDDIYHEKLLPEILDLEIHYPDGSIYKHNQT